MSSLVFEPVDVSIAQQSQPMWVYGRIALTAPRSYALYTVPYGFNLLVRRIVSRWAEIGAGAMNPPQAGEIFNGASARARQTDPVPFGLISSPCGDNVQLFAEPLNPSGVSMTAVSRRSTRIVNLAFPYNDTVRLEITGSVAGAPSWIDLILEGYLVPESLLAMWRNRPVGGARE